MLKENLVMLRKLNGFSQEETAEKIGISRQAYAKWESGATIPDIEKAQALAKMYNVSLDELMKSEIVEGVGIVPPASNGKKLWGKVTLGDRGQIVIPKAARDHLKMNAGDSLIVASDKIGIALIPAEFFESMMQELMEGISKSAE